MPRGVGARMAPASPCSRSLLVLRSSINNILVKRRLRRPAADIQHAGRSKPVKTRQSQPACGQHISFLAFKPMQIQCPIPSEYSSSGTVHMTGSRTLSEF